MRGDEILSQKMLSGNVYFFSRSHRPMERMGTFKFTLSCPMSKCYQDYVTKQPPTKIHPLLTVILDFFWKYKVANSKLDRSCKIYVKLSSVNTIKMTNYVVVWWRKLQNKLHNSDTTHKRSHELRFYGLSILCSKLITVSHKSNFYTRFDVSRELLHEIWLNGRGGL